MVTDWVLIRRAAAELERELRGGRVNDAGLLDDGRFGIRFGGKRTGERLLTIDIFGSPPLPALEEGELSIAGDPGWARSLATVLRGLRLGEIRSRTGDRVLVLDFGTTSRFGVARGVQLVAELIPRFGNVLLLRDGDVIAAAKQFSPAENETRSVGVGGPYRPPPLREGSQVPKVLADAFAANPAAYASAEAMLDAALAVPATEPLHVYRDGAKLVAAHVVPLAQFAHLTHATAPQLLPLFAEARLTSAGRRASDAGERKRAALTARRDDAAGREALRAAGDALYAYGYDLPPQATRLVTPDEAALIVVLDPDLDAMQNAAQYFVRYRKLADALPHLERRIEMLEAKRASLEDLLFETSRGDATTLNDVTTEIDRIEGRKVAPSRSTGKAVKAPLRVDRPSGARIFIGRSPRENLEVTFRIAKPDDFWFHARGIPGSHVVLQSAPGEAPAETDMDRAADFAALHSRARSSQRVEIDYTERKYVRKQRDAAPGMVWYTNQRTRVGRPGAAE
jgi:predicted ribosome quality control (RQC) complex YloA/Tae2 family protein